MSFIKKISIILLISAFMLTISCTAGTDLTDDDPIELSVSVLNIEMDDNLGEIISKSEYRTCRVTLEDEFFDLQAELRGRGNSTWNTPKKPYRLRFPKGESISVLGSDYEARSWTLLANYFDRTLIRTKIIHDFASELSGLAFTPMAEFVELYFNGDYRGIYLVSDQISDLASKGTRVPVVQPSKEETTPGFLLELDHRLPTSEDESEIWGETWFYSDSGIPYAIKTDATTEQFDYIRAELNKAERTILSKNWSEIQKTIDVNSFIDFFLVQELTKNPDVAFSSCYSYKAKGGKFSMGPLWDVDISTGNGLTADALSETPYWEHDIATGGQYATAHYWFNALMQISAFKQQYISRWNALYEDKIPKMLQNILDLGEQMKPYAEKDFAVWNTLNVGRSNPTVDALKTYGSQLEYFYNWLKARSTWLNNFYN